MSASRFGFRHIDGVRLFGTIYQIQRKLYKDREKVIVKVSYRQIPIHKSANTHQTWS